MRDVHGRNGTTGEPQKVKSPDYILAALAVKGVLTLEEGEELSKLYNKKNREYDMPVPMDFASALDQVGPLLDMIAEDRGVGELLGRGHGPAVGECEDCGEPIDAHGNRVPRGNHSSLPTAPVDDDDDWDDDDFEAAAFLYDAIQQAIRINRCSR